MADWSSFVVEADITGLQEGMSNRSYSSKELTLAYMDRIAAYDKSGPCINSIAELNPDAILIAEARDHERSAGVSRGLLHGIPVLLKDNIDSADCMQTTAGSLALRGHYAAEDACIVRLLRQAGAVLLGKTNMSEMAKFLTQDIPNGYSSRGGCVRNPYAPGRLDVGGSSCGSGAAVAASLAAAAIGTETLGSIINPAVENAIVGLNPSIGLVSRRGIIPLAPTHDTAGPMARSVKDAAIMLTVLAAYDPEDDSTHMAMNKSFPDYTIFLQENGFQGVRIGIPVDARFPKLPPEHQQVVEREIEVMRQLGANMVEVESIANLERQEWDMQALVYEFKPAINRYLAKLSPHLPVHSLRDMIEYNFRHNRELIEAYGQDLLIASERTSGTLTEPKYIQAKLRDLRISRANGIDAILSNHKLDALLSPGHDGVAAPAKAGYPSITIPAGFTASGEPSGITFIGGQFSESLLIRLAYSYEQATRHRKAPAL
ncbi:amidase family protein [Paenibacillus tarimensis]|uniref:amidase family protein n=1 Tax=Paenibacillus tarimensis TaxID=416012 RepID=UPI001EED51B1|nr:amidase family protein [Paenibacillus tarimensis]MCF2946088.1 amidase [Paenibacillus tarimensis]